MDIILSDSQSRLLGCLMEKEMATPDYYPLTLNALTNACNQKSNRNPVVSYDEALVAHALTGLQEKKLVMQSNISRVPKYEQIFARELKLLTRERAVICILLVRGPQTVGEIRGRTERLYAFNSLQEVEKTLSSLEDINLVTKLPRQPGRKEFRYAHRLCGDPKDALIETAPQSEIAPLSFHKKDDGTDELRDQVEDLRQELLDLRREFDIFKAQFE